MIRDYDEAAFIDAKCGALDAAARGLPAPAEQLAKLQRMIEQCEVLGGQIGAMFGTQSPPAQLYRSLWLVLCHEHAALKKEIAS